MDGHRGARRDDLFETLQQVWLVGFDLDDDLVAGLTGDLKCFFDSASHPE